MWYQELEEVIPEPKACFSHRLLSCIFLKFVSFTMLLIPVSSTIKRTFSPTSLCTDDSVLWIFCGFQLWNQEVCSSSDRCLYWHRMPSSWTLSACSSDQLVLHSCIESRHLDFICSVSHKSCGVFACNTRKTKRQNSFYFSRVGQAFLVVQEPFIFKNTDVLSLKIMVQTTWHPETDVVSHILSQFFPVPLESHQ